MPNTKEAPFGNTMQLRQRKRSGGASRHDDDSVRPSSRRRKKDNSDRSLRRVRIKPTAFWKNERSPIDAMQEGMLGGLMGSIVASDYSVMRHQSPNRSKTNSKRKTRANATEENTRTPVVHSEKKPRSKGQRGDGDALALATAVSLEKKEHAQQTSKRTNATNDAIEENKQTPVRHQRAKKPRSMGKVGDGDAMVVALETKERTHSDMANSSQDKGDMLAAPTTVASPASESEQDDRQVQVEEWLRGIIPSLSPREVSEYAANLVSIGFDTDFVIHQNVLQWEDLDFMKLLHRRCFFKIVNQSVHGEI